MSKEDVVANSYLNEYRNLGQLSNAPATYDYKKYMATTLIKRGFLFQNSKNMEELYRASMDELFSTQFRNLMLYAVDRDITDIYKNITNIKNMGPIGTHDFLSSVFGLIPAKYVPIFEPFTYENMLDDENILVSITPEEKRNIIIQRGETNGAAYTYTKLSAFDKLVGPDLAQTYFVNPKIPDTIEYDLVDTSMDPDPNVEYYKRIGANYERTTDFDVVDEFRLVSGTDLTSGPILATSYYEKLKNPNTINYLPATGEPLLSTQYYIKDPSDPTRYIITENFNDKKEYVKIDSDNTKFPIPGIEYFVLNSNRVYIPCTDENYTPLYHYTPVPVDYQYDNDPSKYYIANNDVCRLIDPEVDLVKVPVMGTEMVDTYNEVMNKEAGPQPGTTYYARDIVNNTYHEVTNDNLVDKDVYEPTADSNYVVGKNYYVESGDGYRAINNSDLNVSTDTTTVPVDVYNETTDEDYVDGKNYYVRASEPNTYRAATDNDFDLVENTEEQNVDHYNPINTVETPYDEHGEYYVSDGANSYREAITSDFLETPITEMQSVDNYNLTEDESYDESKTYYVSDGADGYREAITSDFDVINETAPSEQVSYELTEDESYDESKTYYVSDGADGYREAITSDFDTVENTEEQSVDHYNETSDESPMEGKTYYVSDGSDGYREAIDNDFTSEETPAVYDYTPVDTSTEEYNQGTTYYLDEQGTEAQPSDFTDSDGTISFTEGTNYYTRTENSPQTTTKTFTIGISYYEKSTATEQVGNGIYTTSFKNDVDYYEQKTETVQEPTDVTTTSFKNDVDYYEKTTSSQSVQTGTTIGWKEGTTYYTKSTSLEQVGNGTYVKHFKDGWKYLEKTVEQQTVPAGTETKTFKIGIVYYEKTGTVKAFDPNVVYYTKSTVENEVIESYDYVFNPDYTYYTRNPGHDNTFTPGVDYYKYEVVGKLFIPTIQYYTKQVIDNGYRYEVTNDFDSNISYRAVDVVLVPTPVEGVEYYTFDNNAYTLANNLVEWDSQTNYYTKETTFSFKQDKEYYTKETVMKFKVQTTTNPGYEYYTARVVDNGYDTTRYEHVTVTDSFEDRDYYIGNIDFDNTELTAEEIATLRKAKIISKINEEFDFHIRDVLTTAKELFQKHRIRDIAQSVHMGANDYELYAIRILYKKILSVICTMVYTINVSDYLDDTCVVYKLINESVDKLLSRVRVIGEMIPTKLYYTKKVLNYYIPDDKKEELMYHYGISSPFADLVNVDDQNITIEDMTMKFTENLINLRSILERTDLVHETNTDLLFGMFTLVYNIVVQLFFNSAYLSRNRAPIVQSVNELFKRFNPNYNNVIAGSTIKDFIKFK